MQLLKVLKAFVTLFWNLIGLEKWLWGWEQNQGFAVPPEPRISTDCSENVLEPWFKNGEICC